MKNHVEVLQGPGRTTTFDPATGQQLSSTVSQLTRFIDEVDRVPTITKGDFHSPNDWEFRVTKRIYPRGTIEVYRRTEPKGRMQLNEWNLGGVLDPVEVIQPMIPDNETKLYNRALSRLNEKARGSLDLSVSALEYHQTLKMLRGAGSIRSYLGNLMTTLSQRGFSSQKGNTLKQLVKDVGGNWLQWHLGLEPLLKDFHDSIQEMHTAVVPLVSRISGKAKDITGTNRIVSSSPYYDTSVAKVYGVQGVHIHVQFRPTDAFDVLRWTSLSPLSWAWETLTLSFVIDWFYNVSAMLRDTETALAYKNTFDSGYVTFLRAHSGSIVTRGKRDYSPTFGERLDFISDMEFKHFRRVKLVAWPLPRTPAFRTDLGSEKLLTAAALLAQQFRRV